MSWRFAAATVALLAAVAGLAGADGLDARGWHAGQPAIGAPAVLGPATSEPTEVPLPISLIKRLQRPTLLFYFSPGCPHCQHVGAEVGDLARRLAGQADVIGVATSSSAAADIEAFRATYHLDFEVVHDRTGQIGTAMGARATPSTLLVRREGRKAYVVDLWYPFQSGMSGLVEMRVSGIPFSSFDRGEYMGNATCSACHVQEMDSWYLTHHSVAWYTLVDQEKTGDPACTACHVTGAGAPTGWEGSPDSRLVDVGCEACHGPGGPHDGERVDARTTCAGCHDPDHSIAFSVEKGLPLIDHFRSVPLDEAGWKDQRVALVEGRASRELLAFADAAYVGAQACQSCHPAAYTWWTTSPHGEAMGSLQKHERQADVACVRCHATPRKAGPASTSLQDYAANEGVGCEACHGPGGNHVAAGGGKDNITGLGSSCPVCVIEAVCTSCHTPQWDPLWDLDKRLPAVHHVAP